MTIKMQLESFSKDWDSHTNA